MRLQRVSHSEPIELQHSVGNVLAPAAKRPVGAVKLAGVNAQHSSTVRQVNIRRRL